MKPQFRFWLGMFFAGLVVISLQFVASDASAQSTSTTASNNNPISGTICPSDGIFNEMIGGVCWSAMFPIRLAGITMFGGSSGTPSNADTQIGCACGGSIKNLTLPTVGVTLGFWQPSMLVEDVAHPFCFPSLDGAFLTDSSSMDFTSGAFAGAWSGTIGDSTTGETKHEAFKNVHILTFPLVTMMQLLNVPSCNVGFKGMDVYLMSEVLPTWNNDLLSMLASPEALLFANPLDALAEIGECASETVGSAPIENMYWTAGCWGGLYPMMGHESAGDDPIRNSSLDSARLLAMGFRLGWLQSTVGSSNVCGANTTFVIPKQQYRFQLIYPHNENNNPFGQCTNWIGQSPLQWGEWDQQPGTGENYVYLVWQWTDCCLGLIGGPT